MGVEFNKYQKFYPFLAFYKIFNNLYDLSKKFNFNNKNKTNLVTYKQQINKKKNIQHRVANNFLYKM